MTIHILKSLLKLIYFALISEKANFAYSKTKKGIL